MITKVLLILVSIVAGLFFLLLFLVVVKIAVRIAKRLGWVAPCPIGLNWILDNHLRRRELCRILDRLGIRSGETVLVLGPGPGVFTLEAARRLGSDRLLCLDVQPAMIAMVDERARRAGLRNVETRVASAFDLPLADGSLDPAFLVTVLIRRIFF